MIFLECVGSRASLSAKKARKSKDFRAFLFCFPSGICLTNIPKVERKTFGILFISWRLVLRGSRSVRLG